MGAVTAASSGACPSGCEEGTNVGNCVCVCSKGRYLLFSLGCVKDPG